MDGVVVSALEAKVMCVAEVVAPHPRKNARSSMGGVVVSASVALHPTEDERSGMDGVLVSALEANVVFVVLIIVMATIVV